MFDNNVFTKDTQKNVRSKDGKIIGYEVETLITYYRSIPISMIEYIKVALDGVEEPSESILISVDQNDWFTLDEATTVTDYKWEYGESLYVRINREGGLTKGQHKIGLTVAVRTAYIPVPLAGYKERIITI